MFLSTCVWSMALFVLQREICGAAIEAARLGKSEIFAMWPSAVKGGATALKFQVLDCIANLAYPVLRFACAKVLIWVLRILCISGRSGPCDEDGFS